MSKKMTPQNYEFSLENKGPSFLAQGRDHTVNFSQADSPFFTVFVIQSSLEIGTNKNLDFVL